MPRKVEYVNAVEAARLTGLSEKTISSKLERRVQELERRLPQTVTRPLTPIPPRPIVLEKLDVLEEPRSKDAALLLDSLQWHQQQAEQGRQLPTWARLPAWVVSGQVEERDQRPLLPQQKERLRK